jgi:putative endonuclease
LFLAGHAERNLQFALKAFMAHQYFVYIMSSRSRNLYTGVTNNLFRRTAEHKIGSVSGFTSKYKVHRLVYYESFADIRSAIAREKQVKSWSRAKKLALIMQVNGTWKDLANDWFPKANRTADSSLRSE